ncbi:MAG: PilZ domain-containing protein [Deltaproteobacteria bacterium]|nr:PilZ domain-containing protein [Deltaproteobacteria bacterium]
MTYHASSSRGLWSENRSFERLPLRLTIQLQHPAGPQLAQTRDLSLGGAAADVDTPPPLGTQVNVAMDLGELGRLDVLAVVTRVEDVVGLHFSGLSVDDYLALQTFLGRQQPSA